MAFYVWSGATGAGTGASWVDAATSISGAFGVPAGDTVYIASDHVEPWNGPGDLRLIFTNSTPDNYVRIISSDRTSGTPPTTYARGAQISAGTFTMQAGGHAIYIGCIMQFFGLVRFLDLSTNWFYDCDVGTKVGGADMAFWGINSITRFINCTSTFGSTTHGFRLARGARAHIKGWSITGASAPITAVFQNVESTGGYAEIEDADVSNMSATGALVGPNCNVTGENNGPTQHYRFRRIKLPANGVIHSGAFNLPGARIEAYGCSPGSNPNAVHIDTSYGVVTDNATVYRAANNGTSNYSLEFNCTALSRKFWAPIEAQIWEKRLSAANPTLTVHLASERVAAWQNDEMFAYALYPDATTPSMGRVMTSRSANILATPAAVPTIANTWTGTTGTAYQIQFNVTGGAPGIHRVIVGVGSGAADKVWACPRVEVA